MPDVSGTAPADVSRSDANLLRADRLPDALNWRYAVKKFDSGRQIEEATWAQLEAALQLAPSSFGLSPWKFLVIRDPKVKAELPAISWDQPQFGDCSHLVVFCTKLDMGLGEVDEFIDRIAGVRGTQVGDLKGLHDMMAGFFSNPQPGFQVDVWSARQVYLALGFFLAACAAAGVDTCPMEGFDRTAYDEKFGLKADGYTATVACACGYRADDDKYAGLPKVRWPREKAVQVI